MTPRAAAFPRAWRALRKARRLCLMCMGAATLMAGLGACAAQPQGVTSNGGASRSSQPVGSVDYSTTSAERWAEALADAPARVDLSRDPADLRGGIAAGSKVYIGVVGTAPRLTERALSTTNGYGGTDEAGTNGESVPTRVGRYLETTLVPAEGPSVPVEFELGVATPDETSDPVDFAPPVGARILILDDATSSLDATTEQQIRAGLAEAMAGRTTFVIGHRLSTISLADECVLMDEGRIIDRGTIAELTDRSSLFRELTGGSGDEPLFVPEDEEVLA